MKRRLLASILTLVMVLSLLPTAVLAADGVEDEAGSENGAEFYTTSGETEELSSDAITMAYDDYVPASQYGDNATVTEGNGILELTGDGYLHAIGVGETTLTAGGTTRSVTVEKAKLNIVLVAGQSNATGIHGSRDEDPIVPAKGNSYWWTGPELTDLSVKVAETTSTSVGWYPALAAEWYARTGEKTVIIHQCVSGSPIGGWASYEDGTVTDRTTSTANVVKNCIAAIQAQSDKYEISHAGYYWLQGETDAFLTYSEGITQYTTAQRYETAYLGMHNAFIAALNTAGVGSYGAILSCRTRNNIGSYQAIEYCGMRVAQQDLANQNSDIYMATVLTDGWYEAGDASFTAASNQFGTLTYSKSKMGVNNIHYSQSGYNVLGLDAADNMYRALTQNESITDIELIGHDGHTKYADGAIIDVENNMRIVGTNNVAEDTDKAQIVARTLPISAACGSVSMTLTDASGAPVTDVMDSRGYIDTTKITAPLTLTVTAGAVTRTYTISKKSGSSEDPDTGDSFYYYWDFTDGTQYGAAADGKVTLDSKADANQLTYTSNTASHSDAGLTNPNGKYFNMAKAVTLPDDAQWTIEWRGAMSTGNGVLLSNNDSDFNETGVGRTTPFLYLRNGGDKDSNDTIGKFDVNYCYKGVVSTSGNKGMSFRATDHQNDLKTAAWVLSCDGNKTLTLTNDKGYSATVTIDGPVTYNGVLGRFGSGLTLCYSGTIEYVKIYSADRADEAATQRDYYWDFTKVDSDGNLAAETTDHWSKNVLTGSTNVGTVQNGGLKHTSSNDHFTMENAAVLPKDEPWTIEWQGRTSAQSVLLANNNAETDTTTPVKAGEYVYIFNDYRADRPEDNGISLRDQNTKAAATFKGIPVDIRENADTVWYLIHDGNGNLTLAATVNGVTFTSEAANAIKRDYTFNGVLGYFVQNAKFNYDGEIKYLKIYHSAADVTPTAAELTMDASNIVTTGYEAGDKLDLTGLVVKLGDQELAKYDVICKPATLAEGSNSVTITVSYMGQSVSETVTVVTPRTFTVTFDVDGKTTEVPVKENNTVTALSDPEKNGYTFEGWYLNGKEFDFATPITGNITLTAAWETVQYTITYELNGGTVATENPTSYNVESDSITLTVPTKPGYTFKGWSGTDLTGDDNKSVTIPTGSTENRSYTANWTVNTYTVTFDKNADDATLSTASKDVTYDETYGDLPAPVRAGFNFAGWFTAAMEGVKVESSTVCKTADDHTLYAHWTAKEIPALKITATPNSLYGGGKVTLTVDVPEDIGTITVKYKAASAEEETTLTPNADGKYTVTLPNRTETYTFTVACAENDKYAYNTASCTVSVTRYTAAPASGNVVSVPSTPNGTVTVTPATATKDTSVTITTKPNEGYELGDLTVKDANGNILPLKDLGGGKYSFVMPDGKVSVEASFVKAAPTSFVDVPANAYFAGAVEWAVENGITNGLTDTMFGPYESCTRAQIVTFLWRAAGSPEPKTVSSFTDVPASAYYAKAVAWAVENGITNGMTETTFAPDATCTRGQSVTFLYRALKGTASGSANFADVASDAFYADAVNWAVANNVTNGTSNTTFSPNADCTRAEIVTFLYRAYQGK